MIGRLFTSTTLVLWGLISTGLGQSKVTVTVAPHDELSVRFMVGHQLVAIDGEGLLLFVDDLASDGTGEEDITYYGPSDWSELRGNLKEVNGLRLTYYDRFDWDELRGKLKSVGDVKLSYYDRFGWDEVKGRLKSVGDIRFTYYDRFGPDELEGKLKSVGKLSIDYHRNAFGSNEMQGPQKGQLKSVKGEDSRVRVTAAYGHRSKVRVP